jgi:ATP-binding cassette subfamily F protein uup
VLILDEPTNDLDIETLELLEEILLEFKGTIILVSHDRHFLDKVVTSLLVMTGDGNVEEQAGSYSDWEARGGRLIAKIDSATPIAMPSATTATSHSATTDEAIVNGASQDTKPDDHSGNAPPKKKTKLSYKEQRELDALPAEIETLEARHAELLEIIAQPDFYEQSPDQVATTLNAVTESEQALDRALERLVELEG